jgi:translation initiation factor 5
VSGKDVWIADTSDKACEERLEANIPERLKALVIGGTEEDATDASPEARTPPAEVLKTFVSASPKPSIDKIIGEVERIQAEYNLDKKALVSLLFDVFLSDLATMQVNIGAYCPILVKFIGAETFTQAVLLSSLEKRLANEPKGKAKNDWIAKKAIFVFKDLYDKDILEEETILQWYHPEEGEDNSQDPLRKAVTPFVKWLE